MQAVYLHKKIKISEQLHAISWNTELGCIAAAGKDGMLKVLKLEQKDIASQNVLTMNQSLVGHQACVKFLSWNEDYRKLASADENGLITVWLLHEGKWIDEMLNNRGSSSVTDIKWTKDGQKICIMYLDGTVIIGSVRGARLWREDVKEQLTKVEWSPDGLYLLFGTSNGDVLIFDSSNATQLHKMRTFCLSHDEQDPTICEMTWYDGSRGYSDLSAPTLAIVYKNGKCQLMRTELDDNPILIDTKMEATCSAWNPNGTILAIGGMQEVILEDKKQIVPVVQFYSPMGEHLRNLRTPGNTINGVTWEGNGLRLAVAVDNCLFFSIIRPEYKWAYFNDIVVYAFTKWERPDHCVVFWNSSTGEKTIKYVKRLMLIRAAADKCCLVTKQQDSFMDNEEQYVLIICNSWGSPIDSKVISVEPKTVTMTETHIIVTSDSQVYIWNYNANYVAPSSQEIPSIPPIEKVDDTESFLFHIDDANFKKKVVSKEKTNDSIVAVCCQGKRLIIARETGKLHMYTLGKDITLISKFVLKMRAMKIALNNDSTKLAVLDYTGVFSLIQLQFSEKGKEINLDKIEKLDVERKDCWDMLWAKDNPDLFAVMQKESLYVYRDTSPEEPRKSPGYLCEFDSLKIKAVLMDAIMDEPGNPQIEHMINFKTKSLRDTTEILEHSVGIDDAFSFVSDNPHPILWRKLAESALDKLNFKIASRAFVRCQDYRGVQFVKYLKKLDDPDLQHSEIAAYRNDFKMAEDLYIKMDRRDLALDLKMKICDWEGVLELLRSGEGTDDLRVQVLNHMGDHFADRDLWNLALPYYLQAMNHEKCVEGYYYTESYGELQNLIGILPEGSPLLMKIGQKFASVGITNHAVEAYLKAGDTETAVNCCVQLNQWDTAVELAQKYKFSQVENLLSKYATMLVEKNDIPRAIELYQRANQNVEAAKLLAQLAFTAGNERKEPGTAKKLYVLAALEIEKFRNSILKKSLTGKTSTDQALNSLLKQDRETGSDKTFDKAWHGAEGYHFFKMSQLQLFQGAISSALSTALLLKEYDDVIATVDIYRLIALCAYYARDYKICSDAFSKLETQTDDASLQTQAQDLAVEIFTKHPPKGVSKSSLRKCPKCKSEGDHLSRCFNCNYKFNYCIVTGKMLDTDDDVWTCGTCKHRAIKDVLIKHYKHCPLCHCNIPKIPSKKK